MSMANGRGFGLLGCFWSQGREKGAGGGRMGGMRREGVRRHARALRLQNILKKVTNLLNILLLTSMNFLYKLHVWPWYGM